jgi:hypothetical protein
MEQPVQLQVAAPHVPSMARVMPGAGRQFPLA